MSNVKKQVPLIDVTNCCTFSITELPSTYISPRTQPQSPNSSISQQSCLKSFTSSPYVRGLCPRRRKKGLPIPMCIFIKQLRPSSCPISASRLQKRKERERDYEQKSSFPSVHVCAPPTLHRYILYMLDPLLISEYESQRCMLGF